MNDPVTRFDAIAFAGGGNRCYWQGGFWKSFSARFPQQPRFYVALSAGAFQACFNLIGLGERVRSEAFAAAEVTAHNTDWSRLLRGRSPFLVGEVYEEWIISLFGEQELRALQAIPEIRIQITHPPQWMPATFAALAAIGAYQIEKAVTGAAHSRAGRHVGLQPLWLSTHAMKTPEDLHLALMATATVPPFMPVKRVAGRVALDGGLVDNPPLALLADVEREGGHTLVLSTRSQKPLQGTAQRTVVRPSRTLTIDKFAINDSVGLRDAFELGLEDGEAFARQLQRG